MAPFIIKQHANESHNKPKELASLFPVPTLRERKKKMNLIGKLEQGEREMGSREIRSPLFYLQLIIHPKCLHRVRDGGETVQTTVNDVSVG